ncbi:MAG: TlpA family protein disulfide reductase [Proteobacteria bacterium]|nr:TlpA family protein disulfide reductase [Pseudomonadota bacterium]
MSRSTTLALVITVALASVAAGLYTSYSTSANAATPTASLSQTQRTALSKLLALDLPDAKGTQQPFSTWKGKVLVVNFWATWCPPCRKEIPAFSALSRKYAGKGVQFVGISIDTAKNVTGFQAKQVVDYPLVIGDPSLVQLTEELGNSAQGLPFTLVIDRSGSISLIKLGELSEQELDRKLAELSKS